MGRSPTWPSSGPGWTPTPTDPIRAFLVPTDSPGFSARPVPHKLSLRASVTAELVLDGVLVPESAVLPDARGLGAALACLTQARAGDRVRRAWQRRATA